MCSFYYLTVGEGMHVHVAIYAHIMYATTQNTYLCFIWKHT